MCTLVPSITRMSKAFSTMAGSARDAEQAMRHLLRNVHVNPLPIPSLLERVLRKIAIHLNEGEAMQEGDPVIALYYIQASSTKQDWFLYKGQFYCEYDRYILLWRRTDTNYPVAYDCAYSIRRPLWKTIPFYYERLFAWMPRLNRFETWKDLRL